MFFFQVSSGMRKNWQHGISSMVLANITPRLEALDLEIVSALHCRHWAGIHLPPLHDVHDSSQEHDTDKDDDAPVERRDVHRGSIRPQRPEEGKNHVTDPGDVGGDTPAAEAPACRRQEFWLEDPAVEDAADGDGVGRHERGDLEGDDGVEGDGGADVDEREQIRDDAGERDGVGGDVESRVHVADTAREGQALVAGKGEGLERGGGVEGDVARNHQNEDHDGEGVDAAGGDGLLEDVDEGEAGGVVDGVFDRGEAEEVGDEEDEGDEAVQDVGPEHGFGDVAPGVFDFFRHMRRRVGADGAVDGRDLADHEAEVDARSAGAVVELREDDFGVVSGC